MQDSYKKYMKYKCKYIALKGGNQVKKEQRDEDVSPCKKECFYSHIQDGENYIWLNKLGYGSVVKIEFEEPVDSGHWRLYNDKWWKAHCRVVDHHPDNLVKAHVKAFIDPKTRFARKRFTFSNGLVTEPTAYFYELERDYFIAKDYCHE